jgi:hypothetical protein
MVVSGTCVLPSLILSRNEVKFNITEEDNKFEKKEGLKLENPFDYDVSYEWALPLNCQFSVEPASGLIKARSNMATTFVYAFEDGGDPGVKLEETIKLKVKHGKSIEVKCSALIP